MPDTKITALTALTAADPANDVLPIVDVSDTTMAASGTTKKISINNVLGCSGTATLASATISGDLTVDTSTLKVDSANNRVGIGTASPAAGAALSVFGTTSVSASDYTNSSTWASRFQAAANNQPSGIFLSGLTSGGAVVPGSLHVEPVAASSRSALIATYAADSAVGYFAINRFSPSAGTTSQHFKIDDTGVATWSNVGGVAGTAMTLNSTGLGVGGVPSGLAPVILCEGIAGTYAKFSSKVGAKTWSAGYRSGTLQYEIQEDGVERYTIGNGGTPHTWYIGASTAMTLNSTGLGVGVSPDFKFAVNGTQAVPDTTGSSTTNGSLRIGAPGTGLVIDTGVTAAAAVYGWIQARARTDYSSNFNLVLQPNGGNVGIGVTPAGTGGCLQLKSGITFPATQVASSDANTLDDYEEGTFTATLKGGTTDPTTPVTATARYTKIGRQVTVNIYMAGVTTTGASGRIQIDGLPFANSSAADSICAVGFNGMATFTGSTFGVVVPSGTTIYMQSSVSGGAYQAVTFNAGTNQSLWVSLTYNV